MYTIDASVHVNAVNPTEAGFGTSQAFLRLLLQYQVPQICPTLLLTEIAASVARALDDTRFAIKLALMIRAWPGHTLVSLDGALVDRAVHLAATARLRGADAVYAAVAEQFNTTLVTLDRQQHERLLPIVRVLAPVDALHELQARYGIDPSVNGGSGDHSPSM
jgi:predicted nucleic acid-binding protein